MLILCLVGCAGQFPASKPTTQPGAAAKEKTGLRFRLSAADSASEARQAHPLVQAQPLPASEIEALVRRLPSLQSRAGDPQAFALRPGSLPPPRTAKRIQQPFPPPARSGPAQVPRDQPLKVTAVAPRGQVEMAPHLTVSFNQPMVSISTVHSLAQQEVPVKLTPQPPGQWRWLGTQTLMFVPDLRFPMATQYQITIPAGVTSASGLKLAAPQIETFRTPPPHLTQSYPNDKSQTLRPIILLAFNQDVDPQVVASKVKLTGARLRLATPAEVAEDDTIHGLAQAEGKDRWVALVPEQDLRPGQGYTVQVEPGLTSKEGPLPTPIPQTFSFSTYDPLRVRSKSERSRPGDSWSVEFNNALDISKLNPAWVKVSPQLPQIQVRARGDSLTIAGRARGRSNYNVTLSPDILDVFGQRLGHPKKFTVQVGSAKPHFEVEATEFSVLDPKGPCQLICKVVNLQKLKVQAWQVGLDDWDAYLKFLGRQPAPPPGVRILDTLVDTKAPADEETAVTIDLSKAFPTHHGHCVVRIEPAPQPQNRQQPYTGWVQSTDLGLDAVWDGHQMVAWVNELASGEPISGAQVGLWPGAGPTVNSNAQGLATLPMLNGKSLLFVRKGHDLAILPPGFGYWSDGRFHLQKGSDAALWHVLDDRKLYRPGETVWIKGWVRQNQWGPKGDLVRSPLTELDYRLVDSVGNEVAKGKARVGGLGGFHVKLALPININLGHTSLHLTGKGGGSYEHKFQVEEFRRPEFEVNLEASPASSRIGSSTEITASAAYFSGGPLANADVNWTASSIPTTYSPPGWSEYTFGTWTPWWNYRIWWNEGSQDDNNTSFQTRTDSKGKSVLKAEFHSIQPSQPHSLRVEATVQDVNRQSWSSRSSVLVHPASLYVGLKSARTFVEKGQPMELSLVVTDLDGKAVVGRPVQVRAYRLDWESSGQVKHIDQTVHNVTSADPPVAFTLPTRV